MLLTVFLMTLFAWKLKSQKRPPSIFKSIFPLVNFSLYMFKTILQIPVMTIIFISFVGSYKQALGVDQGGLSIMIGIFNLLIFIIIQLYLITSFKDCNPFSDLIHAGESITKSVSNLGYKFVFTLYLALDPHGKLGKVFLIVFICVNILWAIIRHLEIGFYKQKIRNIAVKMQYAVLVFSFISLMKTIRPTDELSMLFFLFLSFIMCYIISDYIEKQSCLRAL